MLIMIVKAILNLILGVGVCEWGLEVDRYSSKVIRYSTEVRVGGSSDG
jgi:hypothetical protein